MPGHKSKNKKKKPRSGTASKNPVASAASPNLPQTSTTFPRLPTSANTSQVPEPDPQPPTLDTLPGPILKAIAEALKPNIGNRNLKDLNAFVRTCKVIHSECNANLWETVDLGCLKGEPYDVVDMMQNGPAELWSSVRHLSFDLDDLPMVDDICWRLLAQKCTSLETLEMFGATENGKLVTNPGCDSLFPDGRKCIRGKVAYLPNAKEIVFPNLRKLKYQVVGTGHPPAVVALRGNFRPTCLHPMAAWDDFDPTYSPSPGSFQSPGASSNPNPPQTTFPRLQTLVLHLPPSVLWGLIDHNPNAKNVSSPFPGVTRAAIKIQGYLNALPFVAVRWLCPQVRDLEVGSFGPPLDGPCKRCRGEGQGRGTYELSDECPSGRNYIHWTPLKDLPHLERLAVILTFNPGLRRAVLDIGSFSIFSTERPMDESWTTLCKENCLFLSMACHAFGSPIRHPTAVKATRLLANAVPTLERVSLIYSMEEENETAMMSPSFWEGMYSTGFHSLELSVERPLSGVDVVDVAVRHLRQRAGMRPTLIPVLTATAKENCPVPAICSDLGFQVYCQ